MKISWVVLFSTLLLASCIQIQESSYPTSQAPASKRVAQASEKSSSKLAVKKSPMSAQASLTGKNFSIETRYDKQSLSRESLDIIKSKLKQFLKTKGFVWVPKRRSAHLTVYIQSGYSALIPDSARKALKEAGINPQGTVKVTKQEKRIENGKVVLNNFKTFGEKVANFSITSYINDYGKRPTAGSWLTISAPQQEWTGYEDNLMKELEGQFKFLFVSAPAKNKKMKGDPGCVPRFGYEHENGKVIEVLNGSPAQKAGFKIGDMILSIDSESPLKQTDDKVYESRTQVPVKLKRKDKIVRTTIKSEIMCD